jgi:hypothetical protein
MAAVRAATLMFMPSARHHQHKQGRRPVDHDAQIQPRDVTAFFHEHLTHGLPADPVRS